MAYCFPTANSQARTRWATSYALSRAILNMKPDIIVAGRQAIDGDTAQVGPQVAEKLGWPQITYAEEIVGTEGDELVIKRRLEHGVETVACPLPLVMTVNGSGSRMPSAHAKLVMKCKYAKTASEMQEAQEDYTDLRSERPYLNINEWSVADIDADDQQLGLTGLADEGQEDRQRGICRQGGEEAHRRRPRHRLADAGTDSPATRWDRLTPTAKNQNR